MPHNFSSGPALTLPLSFIAAGSRKSPVCYLSSCLCFAAYVESFAGAHLRQQQAVLDALTGGTGTDSDAPVCFQGRGWKPPALQTQFAGSLGQAGRQFLGNSAPLACPR